MPTQLTVFSKKESPRLQYVLEVLLSQLLGLNFQLVCDWASFRNALKPKINYGGERVSADAINIPAHSLLFEKGIANPSVRLFEHSGLPAFFKVEANDTDLPFDLFAMCFYLISRYEEYLPFADDRHGRFTAQQSVAFRGGFLRQPLVNQWAQKLKDLLNAKFPGLPFPSLEYSFQPTYDVDMAWAYQHKGFLRTVGAYLMDIKQLDLSTLADRRNVHFFNKKDPFYNFDYLDELREKHKLQPLYFFLLGNYGKWDKNIPHTNSSFRKLIYLIHQQYPLGIHPSYGSNYRKDGFEIEKERLENITGVRVTKSRQHFLILRFPTTYRKLLAAGIREDFTMGYAAEIGFRASMTMPYFWYDMEEERRTDLLIHPFQVLDVTLQQYLKLSPQEAMAEVLPLIEAVKEVGGVFSTIWHNSSLSDEKEWTGWKGVYEAIVEAAKTA